jgi:hypothetical protein
MRQGGTWGARRESSSDRKRERTTLASRRWLTITSYDIDVNQMIRPSPFGLEGDVLPQAIFWRPLPYFATAYREDEDGLDRFRVVTFTMDNDLSFDLRTYRGHPYQTVTVYFPFKMQTLDEILPAIELVIAETTIPKLAVAWQRDREFEFGSLRRQALDRLREPEARILALKIAARCPGHTATTEYIKQQVPNYYPLSEIDLHPSPSRRNEARWQQIVGNVISHQKTHSGLFASGYATRTTDGLLVTNNGLDYLSSKGFVV